LLQGGAEGRKVSRKFLCSVVVPKVSCNFLCSTVVVVVMVEKVSCNFPPWSGVEWSGVECKGVLLGCNFFLHSFE
jgi:hypothetical protein